MCGMKTPILFSFFPHTRKRHAFPIKYTCHYFWYNTAGMFNFRWKSTKKAKDLASKESCSHPCQCQLASRPEQGPRDIQRTWLSFYDSKADMLTWYTVHVKTCIKEMWQDGAWGDPADQTYHVNHRLQLRSNVPLNYRRSVLYFMDSDSASSMIREGTT